MQLFQTELHTHAANPVAADFERCNDWIMLLPPTKFARPPRDATAKFLFEHRRRLRKTETDTDPLVAQLPDAPASRVVFAAVQVDIPAFELLTLARKLSAAVAENKPKRIGIAMPGFSAAQRERLAEAQIAALLAAAAQMPDFKRSRERPDRLTDIEVYGAAPAHRFKRTLAEAAGNALARHLTLLPPNTLTPDDYRKRVQTLAKEQGWRMEFYGSAELKRRKAGAYLAVIQGSPADDAGIVRLRYKPPGRSTASARTVMLVGKGVCYDTGGTNLKPAKYMYNMHGDMQGSAVALGVLQALTLLRAPFPVECWMALASNHIGPKSYKPNDVVTACDGTSIEVVHTDAEGRMILADTLALAAREKPALIIDYATLTGACIYALGSGYSGVFTNRDGWRELLVEAGRRSGERVWPFPLDEDYEQALESSIADIKQCALEGDADHILAARFLKRFAGDEIPWVHLDLASGIRKTGLAHVPTGMTGFGVRYSLELLLGTRILSRR